MYYLTKNNKESAGDDNIQNKKKSCDKFHETNVPDKKILYEMPVIEKLKNPLELDICLVVLRF